MEDSENVNDTNNEEQEDEEEEEEEMDEEDAERGRFAASVSKSLTVDDTEIMEEQIRHIPSDFYYELEEEIAKPLITEDSGLPQNLVNLFHSFGYDTFRRDNLKLLENDVICFVVGNYLEILRLKTGERVYIQSTSGRGIGSFDVHSERTYIAIAEKGEMPNTCIYEYPSLKLFRILREGTENAYSYCQFTWVFIQEDLGRFFTIR